MKPDTCPICKSSPMTANCNGANCQDSYADELEDEYFGKASDY